MEHKQQQSLNEAIQRVMLGEAKDTKLPQNLIMIFNPEQKDAAKAIKDLKKTYKDEFVRIHEFVRSSGVPGGYASIAVEFRTDPGDIDKMVSIYQYAIKKWKNLTITVSSTTSRGVQKAIYKN